MNRNRLSLLLFFLSLSLLIAAATWEGSAVVGGVGDFPAEGLYGACNSFPRDSVVEVKNLENGKVARVRIYSGVDNPGVFIALSPKAAQELGMKAGTAARVRAVIITQTASPLTAPLPPIVGESTDPDYNPRLLAVREKNAALTEAPAQAETSGPSTELPSEPTTPKDASAPAPSTGASTDSELAETIQEENEALVLGGELPPAPAAAENGAPELLEAAPSPELAGEVPLSDEALVLGGETTIPERNDGSAVSSLPLAEAEAPEAPPPDTANLVPEEPSPPEEAPTGEGTELAEATPPELVVPEPTDNLPQAEAPSPAEGGEAAALPEESQPDAESAAAELSGEPLAEPQAPPAVEAVPEVAEAPVSEPDEIVAASGSESPESAEALGPAESPTAPEEESAGAEIALSLEPTAPRPPVAPETPAPEAAEAEKTEIPEPSPESSLAAVQEEDAAPNPNALPPYVSGLERGSYYIQVAVFGSEEALARTASSIGALPLAAEKIEMEAGPRYRLYVGPLKRDEGGLVLIKIRALGFTDAFIKQGI